MFPISKWTSLLNSFHHTLSGVPREYTSIRLKSDHWTLTEIVGHLIDSASNNHQRFVRLQEGNLEYFPVYHQQEWIQIQEYNSYDWQEIIRLWLSYNLLLLHIIGNADPSAMRNVWKTNDGDKDLEFLMNDYFRHMKWHIEQFESRLKEISDSPVI
jgi:hypothetical protein